LEHETPWFVVMVRAIRRTYLVYALCCRQLLPGSFPFDDFR
jgi:hypothetical protein